MECTAEKNWQPPVFFSYFCVKTVPKVKLFIPAFIWFVIIYILLTMPASKIPRVHLFSNFDKLVHAGLFGMQVLLVSLPFFRTKYAALRLFLFIAIGATVYGIAMEFVQKYFTPDRDYDNWDILADTVGAAAGLVFTNIYYKRFLKKAKVSA
jgi:VanZ family protein